MAEYLQAALLFLAGIIGGNDGETAREEMDRTHFGGSAELDQWVEEKEKYWEDVQGRDDERNKVADRRQSQREHARTLEYVRSIHEPEDVRVVSEEVEAAYMEKQRRRWSR